MRSSLLDNHGVTVSATTVDMSTAIGTLSAMGRMYGPIMPVMKNIGVNATMIASVESTMGGMISFIA